MSSKILVVDDDPTMRNMVEGHLKVAGYSVKCAVDGGMAIRTTKDWDPELILMDVMTNILKL